MSDRIRAGTLYIYIEYIIDRQMNKCSEHVLLQHLTLSGVAEKQSAGSRIALALLCRGY